MLRRKKMRSIIFEWQLLFSASGRASSTSKDWTHHYLIPAENFAPGAENVLR